VCCSADARGFRPIGRPACAVSWVSIGRDELEAIRLADREGLYQEAAAERMGVSRQTFARILARARALIAESLIEGKALLVQPGAAVDGPAAPMTCPVHSGARRRGRECRCPDRQRCHERQDAHGSVGDESAPGK
jgi:predicted DNA-binding protein (UPF0251 family)